MALMVVNEEPKKGRLSSLLNIFGRRNSVDVEKKGGNALRDIPLPFNTYVSMVGSNERTPLYRWSYRWMQDMYYGSDVLRTIVKTITDEVFKNGVQIKPRFLSKCMSCGYEMFEEREVCPICGGRTRKPNYDEEVIAKEFVKRNNRFNGDLLNTMRVGDEDLNIFDNAFVLLAKRYTYDKDNRIVGAEIDDFLRLSPDRMMLIISNYGMGRDEVGRYAYFCPEHREKVIVKPELGEYFCGECGKQMLRAWYASSNTASGSGSTTGQLIYYGENEVRHIKRWTNSYGYGVSPLYSVYRKVLSLIKIDDLILQAYDMQRSPHSFLVIRGKVDDIREGWQYLMQKGRENPNMVYPLIVEGTDVGTKKLTEKVEFDLKPVEMQMMDMVEKYRQYIGLVYGVSPLFSEGQTGTGLNNEGLQITVTNRTIAESQRVWNETLEWLFKMVGVRDFEVTLIGNEVQDKVTSLEIEQKRTAVALNMQDLGYDTEIVMDDDKTISFKYRKLGYAERRSRGRQMGSIAPPEEEEQPEGNEEPPEENNEGERQ